MWEAVEGDSAYLTGFARSRGFREFRGLGVTIAARRAGKDVFAPVDELRWSVLRWGVLFAAALAIASGIFAARIARRLRAVGVAAERIRLGDVLTLLPHAGNDQELTRMCRELDAMVENFREQQAKLDPSVPSPGIFTEPSKHERDLSKYV
jgi:methyl-accepting chemotaxis protein